MRIVDAELWELLMADPEPKDKPKLRALMTAADPWTDEED